MIKQYNYLRANFGDTPTYTFVMKVKDLVNIYYVAVRGIDNEDGAVQRALNVRRIKDIKQFILDGHTFFNSFILNWTDENFLPEINEQNINLNIIRNGAQVIDGQHRLAGLEEAMMENDSIGNRTVLVTLCIGLSTAKAAEIFLNINTEQKPVPKSLIYDLFGLIVNDEEHSINRAKDIATFLNEDVDSPLYHLIKFPGSPKGSKGIELSTFVNSLKEHLKPNGVFSTYKLNDLDHQKKVILNLFNTIKFFYDKYELWEKKNKNPFLKAVGFNGAIDFLVSTLIEKCAELGSFSVNTMKGIISIDQTNILTLEDLKGMDGKASRKKVEKSLKSSALANLLDKKSSYEF